MNQVLFTIGIMLTGFAIAIPFKNQVPSLFIFFSAYIWGSLAWVLAASFLLFSGFFNLTAMIIFMISLIIIFLYIANRQKTLQFTSNEWAGIFFSLVLFTAVAVFVTKYNFSIATIDSAARIFTGMSLVRDGFTDANLSILGHNNIFLLAIQAAGYMIGDQYLYTAQPLSALSLIGIFIALTTQSLKTLHCSSMKVIRTIIGILLLGSTYFMAFQAFYIHDNLVEGIFIFICAVSFWLANQEKNAAWLFFGSLASVGVSLTRAEGPVFAIVFLILAISQDQFPYKTRLKTYLFPAIVISGWYALILSTVNSEVYFLKPERVLLVIAAFLGLGLLTILSKNEWIEKSFLPYLPHIMFTGILLVFIGSFIVQPAHIWTNITMIASNMYQYGRWNIFWYLILPFVFFTISLPKFKHEQYYTISLISYFLLLIVLGGLRNPYRLGWSDSANRMLVHIVPLLVMYLVLKYASAWQITQEQVQTIIKKKGFIALLAIPTTIVMLGGFLGLTKPENYAVGAKVIDGADAFAENHAFSLVFRSNEDSQYAETKSAGDFTVVIDLQKDVHANIIEMIVESDSTDASAERMLNDIGWAVSSNKLNWTIIYQPPSINLNNVRKVHKNKFQYPVENIVSFRYLKLTFKPVNPEERLKIKQINIWSHSPDGYYPDN